MSAPILAIDPGTTESGYAVLETPSLKLLAFGKQNNGALLEWIKLSRYAENRALREAFLAIEMPASYGMAVGQTVFDTCFWAGRFWEASAANQKLRLFRKADVCMNVCQSMRAKDGNIRQALIDRFGEVGTKSNPGWFYGVSGDVWQAIAVGVTAWDRFWSPEAVARGRGDANPKVEAMRNVK